MMWSIAKQCSKEKFFITLVNDQLVYELKLDNLQFRKLFFYYQNEWDCLLCRLKYMKMECSYLAKSFFVCSHFHCHSQCSCDALLICLN